MKKLFIFAAAAMGFGLVSCDQVELPNPPAQSNPQEAPFAGSDIEIGAVADAATTVYNLTDLQNSNELVPLAVVTKMDNVPTNYEVMFKGRISKDTNFDGDDFACVVEDGMVKVNPDVLNGAIRAFSKNPAELTVNVQLYPYIASTLTPTTTATIERTFGPYTMKVVPFAPSTVIEETYYMLISDDGSTWNLGDAKKSVHSATNVYDDSKFRFYYEVTANQMMHGGIYWKIIPESVYAAGNPAGSTWYGPVDGNHADAEGSLTSLNPEVGMNISLAGPQEMTIDLDKMTFQYQAAYPFFYTPGGSNGWNAPASQLMWTVDYVNYFGFINIDGGFKFNPDSGWNGHDFGVANPLEFNGDPLVGKGVADGSNNIETPVAGVYWVTLDYSTRAMTATQLVKVGLIGDATANGWDGDTLLSSTDGFIWTGEVTLAGTGKFKVRINGGWELSFGGEMNNLNHNGGADIPTPGAGTYNVTVDFSQYPYSVSFVKK